MLSVCVENMAHQPICQEKKENLKTSHIPMSAMYTQSFARAYTEIEKNTPNSFQRFNTRSAILIGLKF